MTESYDAELMIRNMMAQGWSWRDPFQVVLVHPHDHSLALHYDRDGGTVRLSPALSAALALVIPGKGRK